MKIKKVWNSLMYKLMFKNYECECKNKIDYEDISKKVNKNI